MAYMAYKVFDPIHNETVDLVVENELRQASAKWNKEWFSTSGDPITGGERLNDFEGYGPDIEETAYVAKLKPVIKTAITGQRGKKVLTTEVTIPMFGIVTNGQILKMDNTTANVMKLRKEKAIELKPEDKDLEQVEVKWGKSLTFSGGYRSGAFN